MEFKRHKIEKDFIVVGGGIPGICAAIQAARHGLKVALINNRGYIGGNSGAEHFVNVNGATGTQEFSFHARETGIVEEILLENKYKNLTANRFSWDAVLLDYIYREKNIELFLSTNIDKAEMETDSKISYVSGIQITTEKRFDFYGDFFLDDTGDGTLGFLSGAEFKMGREAKTEFSETLAPEKADHYVLPSTLYFTSKDTGKPVKFTPPDFALDIEKTGALEYRKIPQSTFYRSQWYYEIGGELNQIDDNETIIQKHRELAYGIWNYIKNSGGYPSENYELEYVSCIPGKRESRRLTGDYILTQNDIINQHEFHDTVGYGGWSIDLHALEGFFSKELINKHVYLKGIYQIPYRCGYSKNISNLFMAGRCMSTTHVAFGSTRVMATLSTLGQALGTAAYLCKKHNTAPRGIYESHLSELQNTIMKNDQYIVGKALPAQDLKVEASSVRKCELTIRKEDLKLDRNTALIIPVIKKLDCVSLLLKAGSDTTLDYVIYTTGLKENYNPEIQLLKSGISLKKSDNFVWIKLPADLEIDKNKVFIELMANESITLALSDSSLRGVECMIKKDINSPTIIDCETLSPKEFIWRRYQKTPCFKISENIYDKSNITNGYRRPYGLVNLWIGETKNETLILKPEKEISELILVFDSDLDYYLCHTSPSDIPAFAEVVKDYNVYINNRLTIEVRDNFHRINKHTFTAVNAVEIRIEFYDTNGADSIRLYSAEVY